MLYYLKKYPFSLAIILAVIYLSLFKPPTFDLPRFPGWDKVVHFCMYGGISGILWLEFFLNHRREKDKINGKRGIIGAMVFPIILGGLMELGQGYLTSYRSSDWLDMLANTTGVLSASAIAWFLLRPIIIKSK